MSWRLSIVICVMNAQTISKVQAGTVVYLGPINGQSFRVTAHCVENVQIHLHFVYFGPIKVEHAQKLLLRESRCSNTSKIKHFSGGCAPYHSLKCLVTQLNTQPKRGYKPSVPIFRRVGCVFGTQSSDQGTGWKDNEFDKSNY